ncbi:MAG: EAL domain-containing protein [Halothiobacillaceae bacterium]
MLGIDRALKLVVCMLLLLAPGWMLHADEGARPGTADVASERVLTLGVLAWQGHEAATRQWQPLARLLSDQLDGYTVRLVPLYLEEMYAAVADGRLDLVLTQPLSFVELAGQHGLSQLVTLRNMDNGHAIDRFGSVFIRRADRTDLDSLESLRGGVIAGVAPNAFGGWLTGILEIKRLGIDPETDIEPLFLGLPQTNIVEAVLDGRADAGIVRSGLLEKLAVRGEADDLEVIAPRSYADYPLATSTDLYPEWPLAIKNDLPGALARQISLTLMSLPEDHPANRAAGIAGWSIPLDYSSLRRLMLELNPPAANTAPDALAALRAQWPILVGLLVVALVINLLIVLRGRRRLAHSRSSLLRTLDHLDEAVVTTDAQGHVAFMNRAAQRMSGIPLKDALGHQLCRVLAVRHDSDGRRMNFADLRGQAGGDEPLPGFPLEASISTPDGERIVKVSMTVMEPLAGEGDRTRWLVSLHDLTEFHRVNEQLSYRARHDSLTGLFNRASLEAELAVHCGRVMEEGHGGGILWLDIDGFRAVNENASHAAGDALLRRVGSLISVLTPEASLVARTGTDEFGLLLPRASEEDLFMAGQKLVAAIRELRFSWEGTDVHVGVSVGVVVIDRGVASVDTVLSQVVAACRVARSHGGNRLHVHHPEDSEVRAQHEQLERLNQLRDALRHDAFGFMAQRIDALAEPEALPHYELLLRMRQPNGTLLPPGAFVGVAEQNRMMPAIDRWVVSHLFRALKPYQRQVRAFAINLSADSVQDPGMVDFILDETARNGIDPSGICFEITETAAIINVAQVTELIRRLRGEGFLFALDDFGGGLLSFDFLRHFRVDYLKIDGKLVRDIGHDPVATLMVEAVNRIGLALGAETIAEWVEDEGTCRTLLGLGVTHGQGYLLHRPQPLHDVLESLAADTLGHVAGF